MICANVHRTNVQRISVTSGKQTHMPTKPWKEIRKKSKLTEAQREATDAKVQDTLLQMSLREMREMAGQNQTEVADKLETTQSELSRLERRNDFFLSTLRKYVEALGGEVQIIAKFGDKMFRLRGV